MQLCSSAGESARSRNESSSLTDDYSVRARGGIRELPLNQTSTKDPASMGTMAKACTRLVCQPVVVKTPTPGSSGECSLEARAPEYVASPIESRRSLAAGLLRGCRRATWFGYIPASGVPSDSRAALFE